MWPKVLETEVLLELEKAPEKQTHSGLTTLPLQPPILKGTGAGDQDKEGRLGEETPEAQRGGERERDQMLLRSTPTPLQITELLQGNRQAEARESWDIQHVKCGELLLLH